MDLIKTLFIGIPGAGKGTQAKLLDLPAMSTGEILREAFRANDSIISPYKEHVDKGGFVPNEIVFQLIERYIKNLKEPKGYILDGSVRTIEQAEFVAKKDLVNFVIDFKLSEGEARKRLAVRRTIESRKDDAPDAVEKRFVEYWAKTFPASQYLKENCPEIYFEIDADKSIEIVHEDILEIFSYNPSLFY